MLLNALIVNQEVIRMPRGQVQPVEFNNLSAGINTEASPLAFPPNATLDERNFTLEKDGTRKRRKGLQIESGGVAQIGRSTESGNPYKAGNPRLESFLWTNVGGSSRTYCVVRTGKDLFFIDASSNAPSGGVIKNYLFSSLLNETQFSMTSINGELVVSTGEKTLTVFYVEAPNYTNILSKTYTLETRDLWGVDSGYDVGERPNSLGRLHKYNLRNTGWPERATTFKDTDGAEASRANVVEAFEDENGVYPAENDIHYAFKAGAAEDPEAIGAYNPWEGRMTNFGTAEPARGRYILDVFSRGASRRAKGFSGLPEDLTYGGVAAVATYAGRVFYGLTVTGTEDTDDRSPNLNTMIFFSRSGVSSVTDYGKCYAANDPTVEDLNAPLDTDGGFINVTGMGNIIAMETVGNSLFLFADNGVWEISGGEKSFSATNLSISRTTSLGAIGAKSVISAENAIYYWSQGGIYSISIDPVSLQGRVVNLTEQKIQSFYLDIPYLNRREAEGAFLTASRQLRWLYGDSSAPNATVATKELIFDLNFEAFTINEFSNTGLDEQPYVFGYVAPPNLTIQAFTQNVVVGSDNVEANGEQVTLLVDSFGANTAEGVQYLVIYKNGGNVGDIRWTVAELINEDFIDWEWVDGVGVDARAYLLTGALTGGDSQRKKQTTWLTSHLSLTDNILQLNDGAYDSVTPSSCLVSGRWDWTTNNATGRWSNPQQVYRLNRFKPIVDGSALDYGYELVTTRTKIRGSGRALSLYFDTEPLKDCHIIGWGLNLTANNMT